MRRRLVRSLLSLVLLLGAGVVAATPAAAADGGGLVGALDGGTVDGSSYRIEGWAFDAADPSAPVTISVSDGRSRFTAAVDVVRTDVNRPYAVTGAHGFRWTTPLPVGDRTFCVTAATASATVSLGCVQLTAGSHEPVGYLDSTVAERLVTPTVDAMRMGNAFVAAGWAYDPDSPMTPVTVRLRDTAPDGSVRISDRTVGGKRPDVVAAVFGAPELSGFSATIALTSVIGTHQVCVSVVNTGPGSDRSLGCGEGIVRSKRTGAIETLEQPERGRVSVNGWVSGFGDNAVGLVILIGPDGALQGGSVGGTRGAPGRWAIDFDPQIYFGGPYTACIGQEIPGAQEYFDCRQFDSPAMLGEIEKITVADGVLTATGWAIDPLRPEEPLGIMGMQPPGGGSGFINPIPADEPRPDIGARYGMGDNHGFIWKLSLEPGVSAGTWCLHGDFFLPFATAQCFTLDGARADEPWIYLRQGSKLCSVPGSKDVYYLGDRFSRFIDPRTLAANGGSSCNWRSLPDAALMRYEGSPEITLSYTRDGQLVQRRLTYADWLALGTPAPIVVPVEFGGLAWAPPGLAAIRTAVDGTKVSAPLGYPEWGAAGFPTPRMLAALPGDGVCSAPGVSDLAYRGATFRGVLTFDQWAATAFLSPTCDWRDFPDARVRATAGSPVLVFTYTRGDSTASHQLTYAEWEQMGFPQPS